MASRIKPIWPGAAVAAPAFPVHCTAGDNLAVHVAAATAPAGSVLCVDVGNIADLGYWGEVLTTAAESRGIVGLVIDGCVRDVDALQAHGFPVFSTGASLPGATKENPGSVGIQATVGGVIVRAGDWIVGDVDGVVVLAGDRVEEIAAAGQARADKEAGFFEALKGGSTTIDLLGLDASLIDTP